MHWATRAAPLIASLVISTWTSDARAVSISENVRPDFYATNGPVSSAVQSGNILYIAGLFTAVGLPSGGGVPVNAASGSVPAVFSRVGGVLYAVIPDGDGGWYIGGSFKNVGGQLRSGLAHILSDGSVAAWNPIPNDRVFALALADGILYVGGSFTSLDGQSRNRLASFDVISGQLLPWTPDVNYPVGSLAVSSGKLYAGGSFWMVNGVARNGLACFDTQTGTLTDWNPNANQFASFTIVMSGSVLYVRGIFRTIGGQPRTDIAALDGNTAALLPWNPAPNGNVASLAVGNGLVYVGGLFTSVGGQPRNGIAALDPGTGSATAWNPGANSYVNSLVPTATAIYAGGQFTTIGGQARAGIAALNPTTGQASPWTPAVSGPSGANVMAFSGNTLYVGLDNGHGCLTPQPRNGLAAIDIRTGVATNWNPGANASVSGLVLDGGTLYACGSFTAIGGQPRSRLAAFDVATGSLTGWSPSANGAVGKMTRNSSRLFVEGNFTQIDVTTRSNLASFDFATGALNGFSAPASGNSFIAFAASDDQVFVARAFCLHQMGMCLYSLSWSAYDATTGANTGWNTGVIQTSSLNPAAVVLMTHGDQLLIGGDYIQYGGRFNLISVSQATGALTSWNPSIAGPFATVTAFGASGNTVFVAGSFTSIGGQARNGLAALDATTAAVLPWNPAGGGGGSLAATDSSMFVGGDFTSFGPEARMGLAAFGTPAAIADSYLDGPASIVVGAGAAGPPVSGRALIQGVTAQPGAAVGLVAQLGYGPNGTDPATTPGWNWYDASYSSEAAGSDRFIGTFPGMGSGEYDYCFRYSYYGAIVYADLDGSNNGYSPAQAGALTVTPPLSVSNAIKEIAFAVTGSNPIEGDARFRIDLPTASRVRLCIHDLSGRRVATVVDGARPAGSHYVTWSASERSSIAPGIYYARMSVGALAIVRKLVLLR
jgi:hypothetical protein